MIVSSISTPFNFRPIVGFISKTANHTTKENVTRKKYAVVSVLNFGKYAYEVLNVGKGTIINFPGNHNALLLTLIDLPFNRMYELQID